MPSVTDLLTLAEVSHEPFGASGTTTLLLTTGNQLIGTYADARSFTAGTKEYRGWHAHHVVETQDLRRLNLASQSPSRNDQLCVLLPERAHIGRINSVLRNRVPLGSLVTPRQLLSAYGEAYAVIGDYCGGGERLIRRELLALVRATFRAFNLV